MYKNQEGYPDPTAVPALRRRLHYLLRRSCPGLLCGGFQSSGQPLHFLVLLLPLRSSGSQGKARGLFQNHHLHFAKRTRNEPPGGS